MPETSEHNCRYQLANSVQTICHDRAHASIYCIYIYILAYDRAHASLYCIYIYILAYDRAHASIYCIYIYTGI